MLRNLVVLSAMLGAGAGCTVGSSGTCVGAGDCRPGYICRDGSCVAAGEPDPRNRANDAGFKACAAAGGVFRIQYHSIDEIDCLIDTFPVWDNPPTVGVVHQGNGWRVRPFMSLTVEATVTIVVPDNFDVGELACYKVWHRSQAGELWESVESTYVDGEFVAAINTTGEFMLGRDVDALPDVLVWDTGDVAMIDTGRMDLGGYNDVGAFDGPGLPDYGFADGGIPDYGARLDIGNADGGLPDVPVDDLWAPDAGMMDLGPFQTLAIKARPRVACRIWASQTPNRLRTLGRARITVGLTRTQVLSQTWVGGVLGVQTLGNVQTARRPRRCQMLRLSATHCLQALTDRFQILVRARGRTRQTSITDLFRILAPLTQRRLPTMLGRVSSSARIAQSFATTPWRVSSVAGCACRVLMTPRDGTARSLA